MKKIDKLIVKNFLGPFLVTTSVVLFIFLMRFILTYFDEFVGKDIGFFVFIKLFFYFTLIAVPIALPLSVLLACLMTYGNLGEYFELTAIKSSGISTIRALLPIGIISVLVSIFAYWFNNNTLPWANLKAWSLMWDVKTTKTTLNIREGIFYYDIPNQAIKVSKKMADNKTLKQLVIYNHSDHDGNRRVTLADSGQMYTILDNKYLVFELFKGSDYSEPSDKTEAVENRSKFVRNGFNHSKLVYSLSSFGMNKTEEKQFSHHAIMSTTSELSSKSDSLNKELITITNNSLRTATNNYYYHLREKNLNKDPQKKVVVAGGWIQKKMLLAQKNNLLDVKEYAVSSAKAVLSSSESNFQFMKARKEEVWKTDLELHHKFSHAINCFIMFLIGAPLGAIIKKGGLGIPVIVAVLFFIISYILTSSGDKWVKEGILPVEIGAWIANGVLFTIGCYLVNTARKDSRLFDGDIYTMAWNQLKSRFQKQRIIQ